MPNVAGPTQWCPRPWSGGWYGFASEAVRRGRWRRYDFPFSITAYACSGGEFTARPEDFMARPDTTDIDTHDTNHPTGSSEEA